MNSVIIVESDEMEIIFDEFEALVDAALES